MKLKLTSCLLILAATLGATIPANANPTDSVINSILDRCSSTHVGNVVRNNVSSRSSFRLRDKSKKANVGARVAFIRAGGSGASRDYQVQENQHSYDHSTITPVVGQDCSTNVTVVGDILMNHENNATMRYSIDAELYKFDRQQRRERLNRMFRW